MEGKAGAWACRVCKELFLKKHWLYYQQEEGKHLREEWTTFCESWHRLRTRGWKCNKGSISHFYFLYLLPSWWFCNMCINSAILCSCCGWDSNLTQASFMFHIHIMYVNQKYFERRVFISVSLYLCVPCDCRCPWRSGAGVISESPDVGAGNRTQLFQKSIIFLSHLSSPL